ncbi:MAG: hypothetical protein JWR26_2034 [Pedosphaera sp.]|nr:hypothetical protein [Pedosphaera sp.]
MNANALLRQNVYSYSLIDYYISSLSKPLARDSASPLERKMIDIIERENLGLLLFKTRGIFKNDWHEQSAISVYRLASKSHNGFADFILDGRGNCNILLVNIYPSKGFFSLRDFLIGRVVRVLFESDSGLKMITGMGMANDRPSTKRRNGQELVRLWKRIGCTGHPDTNDLNLSREDFERIRTPRDRNDSGVLRHNSPFAASG